MDSERLPVHLLAAGTGRVVAQVIESVAGDVGDITLVDPQRLSTENLRGWLPITPADLGSFKVVYAARWWRRTIGGVRFDALPIRVQHRRAQARFARVDGLIEAANTLAGRRAAIRGAVRHGKWVVSAGVSHDGRRGLVTLLHPARPGGACAACWLPRGRVRRGETLPTATIRVVAGVAATIVRGVLAGTQPTATGATAWLVDLDAVTVTPLVVRRRRTCRACRAPAAASLSIGGVG